jgi:carbamoyltransferase
MAVILGINAFHAGASAALLVDGQPVAAIAEERLNRKKYYGRFPTLAIQRCLDMAGVKYEDIDAVAVGRDRSANRAQKIQYTLANPSKLPNLLKLRTKRSELEDMRALVAAECGIDPARLRFEQHNVEHHLAHVASAYFVSEWDKAAGFSLDGSGDFVSCLLADCEDDRIEIKRRIFLPHSLGTFYMMICEFVGYTRYGDEGKVMGLAPLGEDTYGERIEDMVRLVDGGVKLNLDYFMPLGSTAGLSVGEDGKVVLARHYSDRMVDLFGEPRVPHAEIEKRDMDLAFGLQRVFEDGYMHLLNILHGLVPQERIAMAGGCALNSVANGKMFDRTPFRETCIQPAAGDEGLALGAALHVSNSVLREGKRHVMRHSYLGPEYDDATVKNELDRAGVDYVKYDREQLLHEISGDIETGKVVGWFQGRMEWGPRALGNRSILAHPGRPDMKDVLNARIKHREWFRPFAPSVLVEAQNDLFDKTHPSPFMLHVYVIKPEWRERLCAVNHVDNTGRLQTVARDENPLYYDLIKAFERRTGIPVVLNTSFNENEPIVCEPSEAIDCYLRTKMDTLAIGPYVSRKPTTG